MAEIIFSEGPYAGQKLDLEEGSIVFGRNDDADLVLADGQVSGKHAELRFEDGSWHIVDMESANGTMVNNSPINSHTLVNDDVVTIGTTIFTFTNGDVAEVAAQPAAEEEPVSEGTAAIEEEPVAEVASVEEEPVEEEPVARGIFPRLHKKTRFLSNLGIKPAQRIRVTLKDSSLVGKEVAPVFN